MRLPLSLLLAAAAATACAAAPGAERSAIHRVNPALSPAHAQFLVGALGRLASAEEAAAFAALASDTAAEAFEERFWAGRDPDPRTPVNEARELHDRRAAEADRLYSEAARLGRRTDRGTLHVLFGPPATVDFESTADPRDPPLEVWTYPVGASSGLGGLVPERRYRFVKRSDLTELYRPLPPDLSRGVVGPDAPLRRIP